MNACNIFAIIMALYVMITGNSITNMTAYSLYNVHYLRGFIRAWGQNKQAWADKMKQQLEKMNRTVNEAGSVLSYNDAASWKDLLILNRMCCIS